MALPFHPNIVAESPTLTTEKQGECGILSDEALQFFPPGTVSSAVLVVVDKDNTQVGLRGQQGLENATHQVIMHKKASLKDCLVHDRTYDPEPGKLRLIPFPLYAEELAKLYDQTARAVTVTFPSEGSTNGAYFYDL